VRTIAVVNLKGGSGKTTTALALAVGLARRLPKRKRLLLVDGDPQSNATMTMMDGAMVDAPTLGEVLLDQADVGASRSGRAGFRRSTSCRRPPTSPTARCSWRTN
jgi:chromosome partitioning protein